MVGTTLGHYRLLRLLGKGGMGEVYLAEDTKLERRVALKVLSPDLARDPDRVQRFEREARAAAALNHPNIVTIHSVENEGDTAFLTLEFVDGQTLADLLPPSGLPIERILSIAIPLADAVGAAHQRGIVHRDLKPANVMIANDGRVKVLDFGLAKLREDPLFLDQTVGPTRALTGEGRILGTVAYMSPEQAEGKSVDQRSDVFSLGVILYEMASGDRPFKGDTAMSILSSIMRDTPRPISEIRRELPADFARIVRRCLAKDPEDRYQTAKDLRNDLRGLREDLGSGERARVVASAAGAAVPHPPSSSGLAANTRASRLPWVIGAVAAAAAGVAFLAWRGTGSQAPAPSTTALPFSEIGLSRLTTTGSAGLAAISQDGRYVAHVVSDAKGSSLWLRQVSTSSNVQIVPPSDVRYGAVTFSPGGDYVYYVIYPRGSQYASLQQVPVLGGGARKLVDDIDTAPGFDPTGERFAFIRGVEGGGAVVYTADESGGNLRELAARRAPLTYQLNLQSVAWSPDGTTLAAVGVDTAQLSATIVLIDATSGAEQTIGPSWRLVSALAWTPDGRALVVSAQEPGGDSATQIWEVANPSGTIRRITNDLSTYSGVGLSQDARSLVTVRAEQRAQIWLASLDGGDAPHAIPGSGADDGVYGIAFAPDGRIVYTSTSSGNSDIWIMNADGTNRVQLTTARADDRLPFVTGDGKYIVFVSERDGSRGMWRMDASGGGQIRIGDRRASAGQFPPSGSADGRWLYFSDDRNVTFKTDIDGRTTAPLFEASGSAPALPPNFHAPHSNAEGTLFAGHYADEQTRGERLALVPLQDPAKARLFPQVRNNALFSADGRSLVYFDNQRGAANLWRQPTAGGQPTQLTHFDGDAIFHHALAPDGRHAAIVRGSTISDVILINDRSRESR